MLKEQASEVPKCFGSLFDANEKACTGGFDPAYVGENGTHIRERCNYSQACSARVQASQRQQIIPTSNLLRAQQPTQFSVPSAPSTGYPRPSLPTAPPPRQYGAPQQQQQPYVGVQQMVPVNFGIPQYLTAREPVTSGNFSKRLGLELVRSVGKSLGHTLANFFDTEILGRKTDRGEPGQQ